MLSEEGLAEIRLERKQPPEMLGDDEKSRRSLARCQMVSFGATESVLRCGNLLKGLVGAWGFEPRPLPCQGSALPLSYAPKIKGISNTAKTTFRCSVSSTPSLLSACSALSCAGLERSNWSVILAQHFKVMHPKPFEPHAQSSRDHDEHVRGINVAIIPTQ